MAEVLYHNQRPQEALPLINKGLQVALKIYPLDHKEIGWCHNQLGNILLASSNPSKALEAYQKAIKIYEKQPQRGLLALSDVYFSAAEASHQLKNSQETNVLSRKSLELLFKSEDPEMIERCLQKTEELARSGRFEELEFYFKEAIEACKRLTPQDKEKLAKINYLLGEFTYLMKDDYKNALKFFKESERVNQERPTDRRPLFLLYTYVAELKAYSKDYDECARYLQKTAEDCQAIEYFGYLQQVYYYLAKIFTKQE